MYQCNQFHTAWYCIRIHCLSGEAIFRLAEHWCFRDDADPHKLLLQCIPLNFSPELRCCFGAPTISLTDFGCTGGPAGSRISDDGGFMQRWLPFIPCGQPKGPSRWGAPYHTQLRILFIRCGQPTSASSLLFLSYVSLSDPSCSSLVFHAKLRMFCNQEVFELLMLTLPRSCTQAYLMMVVLLYLHEQADPYLKRNIGSSCLPSYQPASLTSLEIVLPC